MKLFDSHAHYNDVAFGTQAERDELISAVHNSGVEYIINAGTNPQTSAEGLELAEKFDFIYAAVGLHPEDISDTSDTEQQFSAIRSLAAHKKAVAIGEIGLDYHFRNDNRDFQKYWFSRQMGLASELDMPVIVHDRDAHGDCMEIVRKFPTVKGVFHSYSGSAETAAELIKLGWYISFSGVITFKNASRLAEIVPTIPSDRILTETDCPYLTPHPFRGNRNDSGFMHLTAEKAAELRSIPTELFAEQTVDNAKRLFGIK